MVAITIVTILTHTNKQPPALGPRGPNALMIEMKIRPKGCITETQ